MIKGSPLMHARVVKIAPHIIDTLLLVTAIVLTYQWGWVSLQQPWLVAKIIALLAYIGLGMVALREGRAMGVRIGAWLAAILVFIYIVIVAVNKTSLIF